MSSGNASWHGSADGGWDKTQQKITNTFSSFSPDACKSEKRVNCGSDCLASRKEKAINAYSAALLRNLPCSERRAARKDLPSVFFPEKQPSDSRRWRIHDQETKLANLPICSHRFLVLIDSFLIPTMAQNMFLIYILMSQLYFAGVIGCTEGPSIMRRLRTTMETVRIAGDGQKPYADCFVMWL